MRKRVVRSRLRFVSCGDTLGDDLGYSVVQGGCVVFRRRQSWYAFLEEILYGLDVRLAWVLGDTQVVSNVSDTLILYLLGYTFTDTLFVFTKGEMVRLDYRIEM